jgi:dTMP kinase
MPMAKAKFITVEGTEGVGKSTNIDLIRQLLQAQGLEVLVTREPGGTPLAEQLREILLTVRDEPFDPVAELLVVFAARAQHLAQVIRPALDAGTWVLCDRFTDATFAYQGFGRGLSTSLIATLETLVQGSLQPDLTFFLDIDVAQGLKRARHRAELDRFEKERLEFFHRVRDGYRERIRQWPERFVTIDAGQPLDQVQRAIAQKLQGFLASSP